MDEREKVVHSEGRGGGPESSIKLAYRPSAPAHRRIKESHLNSDAIFKQIHSNWEILFHTEEVSFLTTVREGCQILLCMVKSCSLSVKMADLVEKHEKAFARLQPSCPSEPSPIEVLSFLSQSFARVKQFYLSFRLRSSKC